METSEGLCSIAGLSNEVDSTYLTKLRSKPQQSQTEPKLLNWKPEQSPALSTGNNPFHHTQCTVNQLSYQAREEAGEYQAPKNKSVSRRGSSRQGQCKEHEIASTAVINEPACSSYKRNADITRKT